MMKIQMNVIVKDGFIIETTEYANSVEIKHNMKKGANLLWCTTIAAFAV